MASFTISKLITILALVAIPLINQTSAECCPAKHAIAHVCLGTPYEDDIPDERSVTDGYWIRNNADGRRPKCVSRFCDDGEATPDLYCGVGNCNESGCDCEGGCRKSNGNSLEDMEKSWRLNKGLTIQAKHSDS